MERKFVMEVLFPGKKIVFIMVFVVFLNLLSAVGFNLELFVKRIFPFTRSKESFWEPGFEERWDSEHAGWRGNDILFAEED